MREGGREGEGEDKERARQREAGRQRRIGRRRSIGGGRQRTIVAWSAAAGNGTGASELERACLEMCVFLCVRRSRSSRSRSRSRS